MAEGKLFWKVTDEGFISKWGDPPGFLPAWDSSGLDPADSLALQLLEQMVSEGRGRYVDEGVLVPHETVADLREEERTILGLPEPFPFHAEIRASGALTDAHFRYQLLFMNGKDQPFVNPTRHGAYLKASEDQEYILIGDLFRLVEAVERFNAQAPSLPRTDPGRLLRFAEIAGLACSVGATLDHYLNSQKVIAPERITIRLRRLDDGSLEVDPVFCEAASGEGEPPREKSLLSEEEEKDFLEKYDARDVRDVYVLKNGVRLVLREPQKEALRQIKANRRLAGEKKEAFLRAPQEFLDPELIDLDLARFSDRVIEIGEYKPRFFPFLSATGESWFPEGGIVIETSEGKRQVYVSPEEVEDLKKQVAEAVAAGQRQIRWKGEELPVTAELLGTLGELGTAYETAKDASVESLARARAVTRKVLIIKDNFEELVYKCAAVLRPGEVGRLPQGLKPGVNLLEHQREGVRWLQAAWACGRRGALLADDMGLGKTLQALAFMAWVRELMDAGRVDERPMLVVAPQVLLTNWAEEYSRYLEPEVFGRPLILHGDALRKLRLKAGRTADSEVAPRQKPLDITPIRQTKLVITTYETVRDCQLSLGQIDWGVMVLDEAQRIKNPTTLVTMATKAMKYDFGVCLTGTPVENSWIDLWSILDFAVPGHLEPLAEFARRYHYPLRRRDTDVEALGRELKERVGPYILRRTKEEKLKGLPEKRVIYHPVPMPEYQVQRYNECLAQARRALANPHGGGKGSILKAIYLLYEISLHPDLSTLHDGSLASRLSEEFVSSSAKLKKTFEILDEVRRAEEKAVIFLRNRKLQRLLQRAIYDRYGLKVYVVNGETLGEVRKYMVDRFQEKPGFNVIIMSPDAAGVGLNVVAANHVIHLSRPWNPAKEDQATDRVYRIGQKRTVFVHIPLAVHPMFEGGSFDEKLDRLLSRKRQLSSTLLLPPEVEGSEKLSLAEDVLATGARELEGGALVTLEDVDAVAPAVFEALVAALYRKMGYAAESTPPRDRGADVVAVPGAGDRRRGVLVQCKHVSRPQEIIGPAAVREIVAARGIYEPIYGCAFDLAVVTNACGFSRAAVELANANGVKLVTREELGRWLSYYPVESAEVLWEGYAETEEVWELQAGISLFSGE